MLEDELWMTPHKIRPQTAKVDLFWKPETEFSVLNFEVGLNRLNH